MIIRACNYAFTIHGEVITVDNKELHIPSLHYNKNDFVDIDSAIATLGNLTFERDGSVQSISQDIVRIWATLYEKATSSVAVKHQFILYPPKFGRLRRVKGCKSEMCTGKTRKMSARSSALCETCEKRERECCVASWPNLITLKATTYTGFYSILETTLTQPRIRERLQNVVAKGTLNSIVPISQWVLISLKKQIKFVNLWNAIGTTETKQIRSAAKSSLCPQIIPLVDELLEKGWAPFTCAARCNSIIRKIYSIRVFGGYAFSDGFTRFITAIFTVPSVAVVRASPERIVEGNLPAEYLTHYEIADYILRGISIHGNETLCKNGFKTECGIRGRAFNDLLWLCSHTPRVHLLPYNHLHYPEKQSDVDLIHDEVCNTKARDPPPSIDAIKKCVEMLFGENANLIS